MAAADFEPAKARCSLVARHSGSDFIAYGSQSYVAGAALGHALGEAVRAQQDFDDCMSASGWRKVDAQAIAAQKSTIEQMRAIKDQRVACISEVRNKQQYLTLQPHLSELATGNYTMAQLTDDHIPTPTEAKTLSSYVDETTGCLNTAIDRVTSISPAVAQILRDLKSSGETTMMLLIERKLSWGEAAKRVKQVQDEATAKLRQVRV
jgi:hypothetical protein